MIISFFILFYSIKNFNHYKHGTHTHKHMKIFSFIKQKWQMHIIWIECNERKKTVFSLCVCSKWLINKWDLCIDVLENDDDLWPLRWYYYYFFFNSKWNKQTIFMWINIRKKETTKKYPNKWMWWSMRFVCFFFNTVSGTHWFVQLNMEHKNV